MGMKDMFRLLLPLSFNGAEGIWDFVRTAIPRHALKKKLERGNAQAKIRLPSHSSVFTVGGVVGTYFSV